MDKDKLIEALIDFYNLDGMPNNAHLDEQLDLLCIKIENGEFDKKPCKYCSMYKISFGYKHCPSCGNNVEGTI